MRRVLAALRTATGVVIGLFTGAAVIALATQAAVGENVSTAVVASTFIARFIIVLGWFAGTAVGCWVTLRIAKSKTAARIVYVWIFSTVWLSPAVRPASLGVRLACAIAVGIAGVGTVLLSRPRHPTEPAAIEAR